MLRSCLKQKIHSHLAVILTFGMIFAYGTAAWGTDYYWRASVASGDWNEKSNWSTVSKDDSENTGTYPSSSGDTAIFKSSPTVNINGTYSIGSLILDHTYQYNIDVALTLSGAGSLTTETFDFPGSGTYSTQIENNVTLTITKNLLGNMDSGSMTFTGSGVLYIPASGANVDYGENKITYSIQPLPYGDPDIYKITVVGLSDFPGTNDSKNNITLTLTREGTFDINRVDVNYKYKVSNLVVAGSETFSINSVNLTTADGTLKLNKYTGNKDFTITCSAPDSVQTGDGFTITIRTPDDSMDLGTIVWYKGITRWTGASDTNWSNTANWSSGLPSTTDNVTITSGVANYPEISSAVTLKSLTVSSNAKVSMTGGSLTLNTLTCSGNSKFTATDGTVKFVDSASSWSADYPDNSKFFNIEVDTGKTLTINKNLTATGSVTNNGTIAVGTNELKFGTYSGSGTDKISAASGTITATDSGGTISTLNITTSVAINGGTGANGITITNAVTANITTTGKVTLQGTSITSLTNNGALTLNGKVTTSSSLTNNGGTIEIGANTLTVTGNTTNTGTITIGAVSDNSCAIDFQGTYTGTGGTLVGSTTTNPYIDFKNDVTFGTFTANNDIIRFLGSNQTFTTNAQTFAEIQIGNSSASKTPTISLQDDLAASKLTINTSSTLNSNSNKITLTGDFLNNGTFTCSSGEIVFAGTTQTLTSSSDFYKFTINSGATVTTSSSFSIAGNWTNGGSFTASTPSLITFTGDNSTVSGENTFYDVIFSKSSSILGSNIFNNFTCTTAGLTLKFGAGETQTVNGTFKITGSSGNIINLLSTSDGTQWIITVLVANAHVSYAKIKDSKSTNSFISTTNSSSGGNNVNWIISGQYSWKGTNSTWALANNWVNEIGVVAGYPGESIDDTATISDTGLSNYPSITSAIQIKSLSIDNSTSVTLSSNNLILTDSTSPLTNAGTIIYSASGRITSNGSTVINDVSNNGTVEYTGTAQSLDDIGETDYYNLTISNSSTITSGGDINVAGKLSTAGAISGVTSLSVEGISSIGDNISTTGLQTYNGAVTLATDSSLVARTNAVTFNGTINGNNHSLSIGNGTNATNATFGNDSTGTVNDISALKVFGNAIFNSPVGNTTSLSSIEITGTSEINTSSISTTGNQTYTGNVTLATPTTLTSTNTGNISIGTIASPATITGTNALSVSTAGNVLFSGGFTNSTFVTVVAGTTSIYGNNTFTSCTITGNALIYGANTFTTFSLTSGNATFSDANTFTNISIDNSALAAQTTVTFGSDKLQTINDGTPSFKGNSETNTLTLKPTTSGTNWKVYFSSIPATTCFANTIIQNSSSVDSDGTTAKDLGLIPSTLTVKDSNVDSPTCKNWFTTNFIWVGATDSSWTTKTNWTYSDTSSVLAYPSYTNSSSDITINTSVNDLDLGDGISGTTAIALKSLSVNADKRIGIGSCAITTTGNITNNGTIALYGTQATPLYATTITHESSSTIEYYGTGVATDVLYVSTDGTTNIYYNLLLNKTGGTMTFNKAVSASSLNTHQYTSTQTGYSVEFKKTLTVSGSNDVLFGSGDSTSVTTYQKVDVTFADDVTVASTNKLTFWSDITVSKTGNLTIKNSGSNIYFNKNINASVAGTTSLTLYAATKTQFRATDSSNSVGSNIVDFTVSNGTTNLLENYTIQPSGNQSYKAVDNKGTITVATGKTLSIVGNLTTSGTVNCSSGNTSITGKLTNSGTVSCSTGAVTIAGAVENSGTITGNSGTIEIDGKYSSTGTALFTASSNTTTFKGAVDFTNTTFTHNGGTVIFNGTSSHSLTTKTDGSTVFNNITINSGSPVTTSSSFSIAGNWTNGGSFTANTPSLITFTGTGTAGLPISITGNSTLANSVFYETAINCNYVTVSGRNTFTTATFSGISAIHFTDSNTFGTLSFTGVGSTVKFGAGKTQTITTLKSIGSSGKEITLTTDAATPSLDTSTWWNIDIPANFYISLPTTDFQYTNVEYSTSVNNIIHDWGASVKESIPASTSNWFIRTFYWYGKTDTSWTQPTNWSSSSTGYTACSFYPPYDTSLSEIVIADNNTKILQLTTGTTYKIKTLVVNADKKIDLNGQTVTATSITNNGTILMNGTEDLTGVTQKINGDSSNSAGTIEYYSSLTDTNFSKGWGNIFYNLIFADGSSSSGLTSSLVVHGATQILSDSAISLTGNNSFTGVITINSSDSVTLSGSNTISNGVKITAGGAISIKTSTGFSLADLASCTSLAVTGNVTLLGSVTTTGAASQTYNNSVTLGADSTLVAGTNTVTFNGTVNGNSHSLSIGNGTNATNAIFGNDSTDTVNAISALKVFGNAIFNSPVGNLNPLSSIETVGSSAINTTSITSSGTQTYIGAVTLSEDSTLVAGTNTITFNGTVNGNSHSLSIGNNANATNAIFGNDSTDTVNAISALKVFGNAIFNSPVGNLNPLSSIETVGSSTINTTSIISSGTQTYIGAVTLSSSTTIKAGNTIATGVIFTSTVDDSTNNTHDLTFDSSTAVTFTGSVGSFHPIKNLTTVGQTIFSNSFAQSTSANFSINSGSVTFGTSSFTGGKLVIASGASFTQTGYNSSDGTPTGTENTQSVAGIENNGSCTWDSTKSGGTLKLTGSITDSVGGTNKSSTLFNNKIISLSNSCAFNGILNNAEIISSDGIITGEEITIKGTLSVNNDLSYNISKLNFTPESPATNSYISVAENKKLKFDTQTSITGNMNLILSDNSIFITSEDNDITLTNGSFAQTVKDSGIANVMLAGGIITNGTNTVTFSSDVYTFGAGGTDSKMELGGGSGITTCAENVYFATGSAKSIELNSSLSSKNLVLLGGKLVINANSVSTTQDFVLLNGDAQTIFDDTISPSNSGVENLFTYIRTNAATDSASSSLFSLPTVYPDGTATSFPDGTTNAYTGSIDTTSLGGKIFTVNQNFYCNGVNLDASGNWSLKLKDNQNATNSFAELYNTSISNCTVSAITGTAYLSAAENGTDGGSNTNIFFSRPSILKNDVSKDRILTNTANLSGTYTVFDDVIRIEFVDSLTGNSSKIENSNNEISKAIQNIKFSNGTSQQAFENSYIDADCNKSTDGKGDIAVFFLKVPESNRWNTDANGISSGETESTDSGRNGLDASHRQSIPYLNIPKALSSVYQTLRDEHKNRIAHYYSATPNLSTQNYLPGKTFTGTEDRCAPVLIAVRTGQELHTQNDGLESSQPYYDSHNFIELQYSEPVNTGAISLAETDEAIIQNTKSTTNFGSIDGTAGNGLTISALIKTQSGKLITGSSTTGSSDNTVHSIYRKFSTTANGTDSFQTHKLRIGISSYVDGIATVNGNTYKHWDGFIDESQVAGGEVTRLSSKSSSNQHQIYDSANNPLDWEGTSVHTLPSLSVDSTKDELYGNWDSSAPKFALYKNILNEETGYEAIGTSAVENTTLDRLEFHVFDNTDNPSDWYIRTGWSDNSGTLYKDYSYAADIFGGSRPFDDDATNRTAGGVRYSSIYNKYSFFTYNKKGDSNIKNFKNTSITGGAKGLIFLAQSDITHPTGNEDGLYFAVYLEDTTIPLKTTFEVQFNSNAYITDLAGNRMKSQNITTIDRTPPTFNMSVGAVPNNDGNEYKELYLIFNKSLNTKEISIFRNRVVVEKISLTEAIRRSLIFINSETGTESDLTVSTTEEVSVKFQNNDFTALLVPLSRSITYEDIKSLWIQAKIEDSESSADPLSGIENAKVTFIQDEFGNYLSNMSAHALTDFAVNIVNPIYAYDNRLTENNTNFSTSLYQDGSWSVHDWNAEQKNYGTLSVGYDLFIMANLSSGNSSVALPDNVFAYFDSTPDSASISEIYNKNKSDVVDWRIWLPNNVFASSSESTPSYNSVPFKSLADYNNSTSKVTHLTSKEKIPDTSSPEQIRFNLSSSSMSTATWKSGNQISFLFGLADTTGAPITICHSPEYDTITGIYTKELSPLFSLRLKVPGDLSSLDLWSFKLQDVKKQRGGVTILNNVINANNGEKTVVQVNMPSSGSLNVIVMTLDGNIVQYLQHGDASEGEHFYTWNGTTKSGKKVARGLYFIRIFGNGIDETRKVMVVK